jgi:hypothetical protein
MTEAFRDFLQYFQENAGIVPLLSHDHFQLIIHQPFCHYAVYTKRRKTTNKEKRGEGTDANNHT